MGSSRADEDLSASFVSDDKQRRLEFDHELAGYVRGHRERWDITAVLEPLQLLGARTGQVQVHLHRSPLGEPGSDASVRASAGGLRSAGRLAAPHQPP
jgi:hypothetical protein